MGTFSIAIGRRLSALHDGLGKKPVDVCRAIGVKPNRYSQYVTGERPLTIEVAIKLVNEYGVTLDWLYLGDRSKLPADLRDQIKGPAEQSPRRART